MTKLTAAQMKLLTKLANGEWQHGDSRTAKALTERGLVETMDIDSGFARSRPTGGSPWWYRITDAGRAALG